MSTPTLPFPQSLAEKYRPKAISDFAGLEKPKRILGKFAANPYASAWLFVGPPGSAVFFYENLGTVTEALIASDQFTPKRQFPPR
jgi:hypothetical protein